MSLRLDLKVHENRVSRDGTVKHIRTNAYVRICIADAPPVYLQDGQFFAEEVGQLPVDDLPEWVVPELAKCSEEVLTECKCPKDIMEDIVRARAAYKIQQKAAADERRKKLYGNR